MKKLFLTVLLLLPFYVGAATIQTVSLSPGYYQAAGGSVGAAAALGGLVARANPWVNGIAIGATIYKAYMDWPTGTGTNVERVAARPLNQAEIVPAWANDTPPNSPPSTATQSNVLTMTYSGHTTTVQPTSLSAIDAGVINLIGLGNGVPPNVVHADSPTSTTCAMGTAGNCSITGLWQIWTTGGSQVFGFNGTISSSSVFSAFGNAVGCPAGYTVVGGSCNLSNANLVVYPGDSIVTVLPNSGGTSLSGDSRDTGDPLPSSWPSSGAATVTSTCSGAPCSATITPQNGGGFTFQTSVQETVNGSSQVYTQKMTVDANGVVTDTGAVTQPGTLATAQSQAPVATATVQFPSDYARQGEAATAAATIAASIDAEKAAQDADRSDAQTKASALPGQLTADAAPGMNTVSGLALPDHSQFAAPDVSGVGAALPSNAETCVALDADLPYMGTLHIDPCPVVQAVRPVINWGLVLLGVLSGIGLVLLNKPEEA